MAPRLKSLLFKATTTSHSYQKAHWTNSFLYMSNVQFETFFCKSGTLIVATPKMMSHQVSLLFQEALHKGFQTT